MGMAPLNRVEKSRQAPGICGRCRQPITAGEPYVWWKHRHGAKQVRHVADACQPKDWEREGNSKRQAIMQANDEYDLATEAATPEEAIVHLQEASSLAESAMFDFQEAIDAWSGTGLEQSDMASTFEQCVETIDAWTEDITSSFWDLEQIRDGTGDETYEDAEAVRIAVGSRVEDIGPLEVDF